MEFDNIIFMRERAVNRRGESEEKTYMDKRTVRDEILKRRSVLTPEEVKRLSRIICDMARRLESYEKAEDICLYMPVRNEVDVGYLAKKARSEGKNIWLPKVEGRNMNFYFCDEKTELRTGAYGIYEPVSERILTAGDKTLVVMPGAVFSRNRDRIGYGGGYYDRFLSAHSKCMTAAVCYSFQILEEIPHEDHDIKPEALVSEKEILM